MEKPLKKEDEGRDGVDGASPHMQGDINHNCYTAHNYPTGRMQCHGCIYNQKTEGRLAAQDLGTGAGPGSRSARL